jgi:hypothetical protein
MKGAVLKLAAVVYFVESGVFVVAAAVGLNTYGTERMANVVFLGMLTVMCIAFGAKALSMSRRPVPFNPSFVGLAAGVTIGLGALAGAWVLGAVLAPFLLVTWAVYEKRHDA